MHNAIAGGNKKIYVTINAHEAPVPVFFDKAAVRRTAIASCIIRFSSLISL